MNLILNIISVVATFIIIEGVFFYALDFTIGRISVVRKLKYKDYIFLSVGVLFKMFFFDFYLPH